MHQLDEGETSLTLRIFEAVRACAEPPSTVASVTIQPGEPAGHPASRVVL